MSGTDTPAAPDRRMDAMATSFSRNAAESSRQGSDSEALQRMVDDEAAIVSGTICKMDSVAVFLAQKRTKVRIFKQIKQNRIEQNITEEKYESYETEQNKSKNLQTDETEQNRTKHNRRKV